METKPASRGGFAAFLYSQFCAAFNDNVHYMIVALYLGSEAVSGTGEAGLLQANRWQMIVSAAFMAPFILVSPLAGALADRFSKRSVLIVAKWFEVVPMTVSLVSSFLPPPHQYYGLIAGVFLMEVQSAFFSPAKYGIMPEVIPEGRLVWANGILEMLTMIAIVLGRGLGGFTLDRLQLQKGIAVCLAISIVGSLAAFVIPRGSPGDRSRPMQLNPVAQVFGTFRHMPRPLIVMLFALSLFWLVSALYGQVIPVFGPHVLGISPTKTSLLLAIMSIGIGLGALVAGSVRSPMIALGLVPPSALGMGLASIGLWAWGTSFECSAAFLSVVGFFAGIYLVPQNAAYQTQSPAEHRGACLAALNFVSFGFMALASLVNALLTDPSLLDFKLVTVFLVLGIGVAVIGLVQCLLSPELIIAMILGVMTRIIYRVRVSGESNIPREGGVLITPNHISLVDALFLITSSPRPLRFVIEKAWYDTPLLKPLFKILRLIPISPGAGSRGALQAAQEAVKNGDAVVIFPEGELTRIGNIQRFRPGLERIAKETGVPILPVHLDRLWGSIFSHKGGQLIWKVPRRIPYPVTVTYGEPLPPDSTAFQVRQAVTLLATRGFRSRLANRRALGAEFVRRAKRSPFKFAMSDSMGLHLNYLKALIRSAVLSRLIRKLCRGRRMVGIVFPPSVAGALCNVAAQLAGKTPVNLNWTVGAQAYDAAIKKCELGAILTSRKVLEKLNLAPRPEYVFLEDLARQAGALRAVWWATLCCLLPTEILTWLLCAPQKLDDDATIIFSSGSTAEPKGVRLTHANILSNAMGIADVFPLTKEDRILGALPFFHSFGFTITIWLPLLGGFGVSYHPNPLDGRGVGKRARESGATMMTATPTFLQIYTRQCEPEDLKTIRHVIVGAEKLHAPVAEAFEKKFGITPREGYGCTELSPCVSVNAPDVAGPGVRQVATRAGTIGRPLPGVAVKVVDPDTFAELGPGENGLILVAGCNVMAGYLNDPERTSAVLRDGWYMTGDIGKIDDDGFITITDRLSRFSKIGGEMVPHVKVEEAIQEACGKAERCVVVAAVADPDKGERLIVLHTEDLKPAQIISALREKGLPSLWIPKADAFFRIDEIPLLGSGKVNLAALKELAKAKAAAGYSK